MKNLLTIISFVFSIVFLNAQNVVVHNSGNNMYAESTSAIDSIKFDSNYSKFNVSGSTSSLNIQKAVIDSITFSNSSVSLDKIYIIWNGTDDVTVINPYSNQGVTITTSSGTVNVTATSGIANLEYHLLGTSSVGSLTMSSDQPANFVLNNVNLTNASGAAIILTGAQTHTFTSQNGTTNTLIDGSSSSKNGTLQSDGAMIFNGSGILSVTGVKKHALYSSLGITVNSGTITIPSATSDGFHSEGFTQTDGILNIVANGDAIDSGDTAIAISGGSITTTLATADTKAIKTGASTIDISGGTLNLTLTGAQSKAIKADGNITINAGSITANLSGAAVLTASGSGYDPSYSTAIKSDSIVTVNGGTLNLTLASTANGGKGISANSDVIINGGTITISTAGNGAVYVNESGTTDSYTSSTITSDTNVKIYAGTLTLSSSGTGGKGISSDGEIILGNSGAADSLLNLNVTTSGNRFLVSVSGNSADYANPKGVKADGNLTLNSGTVTINCTQTSDGGEGLESKATLTINGGTTNISTWDDSINAATAIVINGGTTYAYAKNNDGIDSNGTMTINGGFTISNGARTPEEGFDCDQNTFKITGGKIVGTGGATSNPTTSVSTQRSVKVTTTAGNNVHIKNAAGTTILMYKVPAYYGTGTQNTVTLLFTDPAIVNGTYTVQRGGTISGGTETHGYVTGGTYTGGTSTSFTVSTMLTTVN